MGTIGFIAVLALIPASPAGAGDPSGDNHGYKPESRPEVKKEAAGRAWAPVPLGGFVLGHRRVGVELEAGYPFMRAELSYGLWSRIQLFAGYQSLYTLTHGGYGGIKLGLITTPAGNFGLSVSALGGFTHLTRAGDFESAAMAGGTGGFGAFMLSLAGRSGRNGFFVNAGMRMSQVADDLRCETGESGQAADPVSPSAPRCLSRENLLTTVFLEGGWAVRLTPYVSYYAGAGVDVFSGGWYPAMVRFRTGVLFDF